ncbi:MAG: LURP-one-related family protein [Deltaproteobacteria bacterium]|nr:LURP-one-related family protein [Deltaproteobacteria bacterium]
MRYIMKQKFWSLGDDFFIKDENEEDIYRVRGKAFSCGDKLHMHDMDGAELANISQKMLSLTPRYEINKGDQKLAEIIKEVSWFKSKFTLDVPGPNDYTISGSLLDHEYGFKRNGNEVAWVSKKHWSLSDTYGIEIADDEDEIAILATCVVIDLVCHDEKGL